MFSEEHAASRKRRSVWC